jgi:RNA polymerase sigma-70 factor (ECF subfamily)
VELCLLDNQALQPADNASSEEAGIVERVKAGDSEAFSLLVDKYQNRIFNFVKMMVQNREEAEDLTQEALIKGFNSIGKLQSASSFKSWLFRIANNTVLDSIRRKRIEIADAEESLKETYVDSATPETRILTEKRTQAVKWALSRLKEEQRRILVLCDLEGLSYREISDALNVPFGTVQSRIFYARRKLKELLDETKMFKGDEQK